MDSTRVCLTDGLRYFFIIPSDQPTPTPTPTPTATATWWGKLVGVEGNKKERPRSENEREMNGEKIPHGSPFPNEMKVVLLFLS